MQMPQVDASMEFDIAQALSGLVKDLRRVDIADYSFFQRLNSRRSMADIIENCADVHFAPGFVTFEDFVDVAMDWDGGPCVKLRLALAGSVMQSQVEITLMRDTANVRVVYFEFSSPHRADVAGYRAALQEIRTNQLLPGIIDSARAAHAALVRV
jgi:hypothetical protein